MSEKELTEEEIVNEKLIGEVQKHVNVLFMNDRRVSLEKTWSKIASAVSATVKECKQRWKILHQQYVQEYERMTTTNGGVDEYSYFSDWKYIGAMDFMKDYLFPAKHDLETKSEILKDIFCRACLQKVINGSEGNCNIRYNIFETQQLAQMLAQCTNLQIDPWDEYPHSICAKCYEKVLDFYQFHQMCHDSLDKFNNLTRNGVKLEIDEAEDGIYYSVIEPQNINTVLSEGHLNENHTTDIDNNEMLENKPLKQCEDDLGETTDDDPLAENEDQEFIMEDDNAYAEETEDESFKETRKARKKICKTDNVKEKGNKAKIKKENKKYTKNKNVQTKSKMLKQETSLLNDETKYAGKEDKEEFEATNQNILEDEEEPQDDNWDASEVLEKQASKVRIKCEICPKTFRFQHCLDAHLRRHQGLSGYACTFENCDRAYNRLTDLTRHLNDHKGIPNIYKCDIDDCGKTYKCYSRLNQHKREFHKCGKEYQKKKKDPSLQHFVCETCGKVLSSPNSLRIHSLIHVDKSQWPYECDEEGCTRRFNILQKLKVHKMRHAGIKNFVCPHCGMRKTTRHELNIHINFHTFERKYPCRICSKVFKSVGSMCTHIRIVHEGKRSKANKSGGSDELFACSFCDRKLSTLQNKKFHEMTHTGEKAHACEECGKTFSRPDGLKQHMNMHVKGEKQFACEECGKRYKWPAHLKTHMKMHLEGANPFPCDECGKRFKWASNLQSHKKLHSEGGTPYTCEVCGQGFRWPGSYYAHKKKHLNIKVENTQVAVAEEEALISVIVEEVDI